VGNFWSRQTKLSAADSNLNDDFGYAASLFSNTAFICSVFDDDKNYDVGTIKKRKSTLFNIILKHILTS
jgi:hypothetical protein